MDRHAVLAAFDEQLRRHPAPDALDGQVEYDHGVVRIVGAGDAWAAVIWCDLDHESADAVIAAQVRRFAQLHRPWEWKHYSYDQPPDLPDRLLAAGFTPEPAEALLVAEVADLPLEVPPPPGVEVRAVTDEHGVEALVSVHDQVFGEDHSAVGSALLAALARQPSTARPWSPSPGGRRSPPGGWSSTMAATSPACGAAVWCLRGGTVACSARWWPTGPPWRRPEASATSRSMPCRTADRSSNDSASSSWPPQPRSPTPAERADLQSPIPPDAVPRPPARRGHSPPAA
jgi:hypothetical protein